MAPHAASSAAGLVCAASHAAASAFHSSAFLSGWYRSIGSLARNGSGNRRAMSSATHAAICSRSRCLRATEASAALSDSGGARRYRPLPFL